MSQSKLDQEVLAKLMATLKTKVSGLHFSNWIKPASFSLEDSVLKILVPNKFIRDWISDNYLELIKYELYRLTGEEHQVRFGISPQLKNNIASSAEEKPKEPTPSPKRLQPSVVLGKQLNQKYDFDQFVVGPSNQFAYAAARAVAEQPALAYNPLFIYGGVGLGKTHLLHAIGRHIQQKQKGLRILYVNGEHFTNELVKCIQHKRMFEFRKKYRESCDLLLMDDVQFISGKERTQEEFFHTFNYLYEARRQLVLTSDRPPRDILELEDRLRSRFEWGLMADVQAPDTETRMAILRKKAASDKISLSEDLALFLAKHFQNNVRELEGSLTRLSAFAQLNNCKLDLETGREALKEILPGASQKKSVEFIQDLVADHYRLKVSDLKSPRRLKTLAVPRQIAMFLCRKHVGLSFPELGRRFGGKDHSTVVHAVQKIERLLGKDQRLSKEIEDLERQL